MSDVTITVQQLPSPNVTVQQGNFLGIGTGAITSAMIADGTITGTDIASATITGGNIAAGTITATNIASGAVGSSQIAAGAVGSSQIASGAVGASQIATGAVTTTQILDGTITGTDIASSTVAASNLTALTQQGLSRAWMAVTGSTSSTNPTYNSFGGFASNAVTRTATGSYTITCPSAPTCVFLTPWGGTANMGACVQTLSGTSLSIKTYVGTTLTDMQFFLVLFY